MGNKVSESSSQDINIVKSVKINNKDLSTIMNSEDEKFETKKKFIESGNYLRSKGQYQESIECYDQAIAIDPKDPYAYNCKGNALADLKQYKESITFYDYAIKFHPTYMYAYMNKGIALFDMGKFKQALECYDQSILLKPEYAPAYNGKGNTLFKLGKNKEALAYFDIAITLDPQYVYALINKGNVLYKMELYEDSIKCIDQALLINPNNSKAYNNKGYVLKKMGRNQEAIQCFNKAIQFENSSLAVINKQDVLDNSIDMKTNFETQENQFYTKKTDESFIDEKYEKIENFNFKKEEVKIVNEIGEGGFGTVYFAYMEKTEVCVKVIKIMDKDDEEFLKKMNMNEVYLLNQVKHPNLINYFGCYQFDLNRIAIVTEYCRGGDLFRVLREKNIRITLNQKIKILCDVACGMVYLHQKSPPIIHRDLKSMNILLEEKIVNNYTIPKAKVSDFGLARIIDESKSKASLTGGIGTVSWTAPEILRGEKYGLKADIYSFGVVIWEIFCETLPYSQLSLNQYQIIYQVTNLNLRPDMKLIPNFVPQEIKFIIENCFKDDPKERPSFVDIYNILKIFL